MRFTVYDDSDTSAGQFGSYGEATAAARQRSAQADRPDAVYSVRDNEHDLTRAQFCRGETLRERVHKNALQAIFVARSSDQLSRVVAEYADELGFPELAGIDYDEAVTRTAADRPAMAEVFQAAAEKADLLKAS